MHLSWELVENATNTSHYVQHERLDRTVLQAVLAVLGLGTTWMVVLTLPLFPEWIRPYPLASLHNPLPLRAAVPASRPLFRVGLSPAASIAEVSRQLLRPPAPEEALSGSESSSALERPRPKAEVSAAQNDIVLQSTPDTSSPVVLEAHDDRMVATPATLDRSGRSSDETEHAESRHEKSQERRH